MVRLRKRRLSSRALSAWYILVKVRMRKALETAAKRRKRESAMVGWFVLE